MVPSSRNLTTTDNSNNNNDDNTITTKLTEDELNKLTDRYNSPLLAHSLTIFICDEFGKTLRTIGNKNNRRDQLTYKIIQNNYAEHLEDTKYDTYFYTTLEEITQILDFITSNPKIFKKDINEEDILEVYRNDRHDTFSLDEDDIDDILATIDNLED